MVTVFDHLPDLSLLEVFSYLSTTDALWSLSNLNVRLTILLTEQGFYRHVNLSSTRYSQFRKILSLLRLNEIQSLTIDYCASSFQLSKWPCLPHLITLRIKGVCNLVDVFVFVIKHANTLSHLTAESSGYHQSSASSKYLWYPVWNLCDFLKRFLPHMSVLRSIDFGMETSFHLHLWPFKTIPTFLTYLRVTLGKTYDLINIMTTKPLSSTLQQLHVKISDMCLNMKSALYDISLLPSMSSLHTFTFIKSFKWHVGAEWPFIHMLTRPNIMPVLRRMKFCIVIDVDDLKYMSRSTLFTDSRRVDVRYAFMINDDRQHLELKECVPSGSRSHPRQIASATFISEHWPNDQTLITSDLDYFAKPKNRQHLFYTLPWTFDEFPQLCVPDTDISELKVYPTSLVDTIISSSHLIKLNMSDNLPSSTTFFPHVTSTNPIVQLHLFRCNRQVSMNLPIVDRLILTDSLDSLNSSSFSRNIRSIEIILHYERLCFATNDWTPLRTLSNLPFLHSLRILIYDMHIPPDNTSCQIIANTASIVSNFSFCFRRCLHQHFANTGVPFAEYSLFIEQLRNHILALPRNEEPCVVVEKWGCGLIVWF